MERVSETYPNDLSLLCHPLSRDLLFVGRIVPPVLSYQETYCLLDLSYHPLMSNLMLAMKCVENFISIRNKYII